MDAPEETAPDAIGSERSLTPGMTLLLRVVGAVAVAVLGGAVWLFVVTGNTAGPGGTGSSTGSSTTAGDPGAGSPEVAAATAGPLPGAGPTSGSEVEPPAPVASDRAHLPPLPAPTPRVQTPLPASASASGSLVDGFPVEVMGVAPGSEILESAITSDGTRMQVTLTARTDASIEDVRAHYREQWTAPGLASVGAGDDVAASDEYTSLSLEISASSGTGTVYLLYGVFRTR